jgi:hypothetical protein
MDFNKVTKINLGNGIEQINRYAFYNTKITSFTIHKSVKLIDSFAFSENKELETIMFDENEDENNELIIKEFAFEKCSKITSFYIPKR